jgi:hypothetical protein
MLLEMFLMLNLLASRALFKGIFLITFGKHVVSESRDLHDLLAMRAGGEHDTLFKQVQIHSVLIAEGGISFMAELARRSVQVFFGLPHDL